MWSQFYATAFAKSAQLRTHQTPLWSEWIITLDCVYWCKFDILPEVPSPFYIPCLVLVRCITITDSSSFGNYLPVSRRPHMTTGWSLSFLPRQYCANTSACTVISGKHPFMYTFFMPKRLWRSKKWRMMILREKRWQDNILQQQRLKTQKDPSNSNLLMISEIFCSLHS